MNPTARAARRMQPNGAYMSKAADPQGAGMLNKREQARADTFYRQKGMVSPAEQRAVPNNPRNADSHADAANAVSVSNLYGDWQQEVAGTGVTEVMPIPPALGLMTQPWQSGPLLALQEGLKMSQMQARTGFSPAQQMPNELVLNNQPIAREGVSGYEGNPLPAQPMVDFSDLQLPVQRGQAPLPTGMELDPRHAPLTVIGDPGMASLPRMGAEMKSKGKGKPSSMPPTA